MRMKTFTVRGTVHTFPMEAAWYYIPIPTDKIPDVPRGGWGSVPVQATIGKTTWQTSIFPMKKDHYFIPLKKSVRTKEDIFLGDTVTITYVHKPRAAAASKRS